MTRYSFRENDLGTHPAGSAQSFASANQSHTAHFYSSDVVLLSEIAPRLAANLAGGGAAIVIATPEHCQGLEQQLAVRGVDLSRIAHEGRWVTLDAAETIQRFMVNRRPDPARFASVIGGALDRLAAVTAFSASTFVRSTPEIMAYGEMVALLWEQGNPEAAIEVEELWNDLARTRRFSLSCGWPLRLFKSASDNAAVQRICSRHTHVTPRAAMASRDDESRRGGLLWRLKSQALLQRASHIGRQTLAYYREAPLPQPIEVAEVIEDVLAVYRHRLHQKQLSMRKRIQDHLRVELLPAELDQVVSNLISDAIDASPPGTAIYLRAWQSHDPVTGRPGMRIAVADGGTTEPQGGGLPASRSRFRTAGDARERLGLSIVRDLLTKRGGSLRLRAANRAAKAGVVMTLFLPGQTAMPDAESAA